MALMNSVTSSLVVTLSSSPFSRDEVTRDSVDTIDLVSDSDEDSRSSDSGGLVIEKTDAEEQDRRLSEACPNELIVFNERPATEFYNGMHSASCDKQLELVACENHSDLARESQPLKLVAYESNECFGFKPERDINGYGASNSARVEHQDCSQERLQLIEILDHCQQYASCHSLHKEVIDNCEMPVTQSYYYPIVKDNNDEEYVVDKNEGEEKDVKKIDAEEIDAEEIDAEEIDAEEIDAEEIDAEEIDAEEIDAEEIDAEEIDADENEENYVEEDDKNDVETVQEDEGLEEIVVQPNGNKIIHDKDQPLDLTSSRKRSFEENNNTEKQSSSVYVSSDRSERSASSNHTDVFVSSGSIEYSQDSDESLKSSKRVKLDWRVVDEISQEIAKLDHPDVIQLPILDVNNVNPQFNPDKVIKPYIDDLRKKPYQWDKLCANGQQSHNQQNSFSCVLNLSIELFTGYESANLKRLHLWETVSPKIQCRSPQLDMRPKLVELILNCCNEFELTFVTANLAVLLLDIFMESHLIEHEFLELAAVTSLWIAAKYEDRDAQVPTSRKLRYECESHDYTAKHLVLMEAMMLKYFKFSLGYATPATFLEAFTIGSFTSEQKILYWACSCKTCNKPAEQNIVPRECTYSPRREPQPSPTTSISPRYSRSSAWSCSSNLNKAAIHSFSVPMIADLSEDVGSLITRKIWDAAHHFMNVSLMHSALMVEKPSKVAAACLLLARETTLIIPIWNEMLEHLTAFDEQSLKPICDLLRSSVL